MMPAASATHSLCSNCCWLWPCWRPVSLVVGVLLRTDRDHDLLQVQLEALIDISACTQQERAALMVWGQADLAFTQPVNTSEEQIQPLYLRTLPGRLSWEEPVALALRPMARLCPVHRLGMATSSNLAWSADRSPWWLRNLSHEAWCALLEVLLALVCSWPSFRLISAIETGQRAVGQGRREAQVVDLALSRLAELEAGILPGPNFGTIPTSRWAPRMPSTLHFVRTVFGAGG